ncbi:hypothetical protein D9M68_274100 [compost metagenome]
MRKFRVLLLGFILLLAACTDRLWLIKPFDVSKSNQVVMANFLIKEKGTYQLSLSFVWKESRREREEQTKIIGNGGVPTLVYESDPEVLKSIKGVPIPLHVRLVKDGELLVDELFETSGKNYGQSFDYGGQSKSAAGRVIKNITLEPGNYFVEVRTVKDVAAFSDTETYFDLTYYNPKI